MENLRNCEYCEDPLVSSDGSPYILDEYYCSNRCRDLDTIDIKLKIKELERKINNE